MYFTNLGNGTQKKIDYISPNDFMKMSTRRISKIVQTMGKPRNVLIVPDGTRRVRMTDQHMNPLNKDFLEKHFRMDHEITINILKNIFDCGIRTIFFPGVTHGNLKRSGGYLDGLLKIGMKYLLSGDRWMDFYKKYKIRVRVYGDLDYVASIGYPEVKKWAKYIQKQTRDYDAHVLFHGIAVSRPHEEKRLVKMAVDFFKDFKRYPSDEELQILYFGEIIDPVDIFIRTVEVRDSGCQPILAGDRAEMYFPVTPFIYLSKCMFKSILYDYIFNRMKTFSKKDYDSGIDMDEIENMAKYYRLNRNCVLGLGKRKIGGKFWIPNSRIRLPKDMDKW